LGLPEGQRSYSPGEGSDNDRRPGLMCFKWNRRNWECYFVWCVYCDGNVVCFLSSSQTGCSFIIAIKEPKDLDAKNFVTHNDLKSKQNNIHSYLVHGILFFTTFSSMGPNKFLNVTVGAINKRCFKRVLPEGQRTYSPGEGSGNDRRPGLMCFKWNRRNWECCFVWCVYCDGNVDCFLSSSQTGFFLSSSRMGSSFLGYSLSFMSSTLLRWTQKRSKKVRPIGYCSPFHAYGVPRLASDWRLPIENYLFI